MSAIPNRPSIWSPQEVDDALRDGTLDIEQAGRSPYLNSDLSSLVRRA